MSKRKMRKMGGPVFYRSWKPITRGKNAGSGGWDEDDMVGGVIVDTTVDKKYNRTNYHIKVEEMEFAEPTVNQEGKEMALGDTFVLNGCGTLEKHLASCERGDYVQVIFKGEAEITSGEWEGTMAINLEVYLEDKKKDVVEEEEEEGGNIL